MTGNEAKQRDIDWLRWVGMTVWLVFLVGGAGAVTSAVLSLQSRARMTAHTRGVVVGLQDAPDYNHTNYFYPRVRFVVAGEEVQFVGSVERQEGEYEPGDPVDVIYAPDEPTVAALASAEEDGQEWPQIVLGALLLLVALAFAVRAIRRGRAARAAAA